MNAIPARNLRAIGAGLALVVLLAIAAGISTRAHTPAPDAGLPTTEVAVALGILDRKVVDDIRAGGADAYVSLNVEPLIAEVYKRFPDAAQQPQLVQETDRLVGTLKDQLAATAAGARILDRLEGLARLKVRFTSDEDVLTVLRLPFVSAIRTNRLLLPTLKESTVLVHQPQVKAEGYDGAGTYVAVLDTGVRWSEFPDFFPDPGMVPDDLAYVATGADLKANAAIHGTHVASTVLAMAPATKIIAVEVFHPLPGEVEPSASDVSINDGVRYVLDLKKAWIRDHSQCCNVVALNLSLGLQKDYEKDICSDDYSFDLAYAYGILPVVASGNDADALLFWYLSGIGAPACGRHALSVGSSTDGAFAGNDGCDPSDAVDHVSTFSQSAEILGLLAPGQCITAAGGSLQGTSMATPHVAGAVAVLASAKADATPAQIWNALVSSGTPIADSRFDPPVKKNRLDLEAAVRSLLAGTAPATAPAPPPGVVDAVEVGQGDLDPVDPIYGGEREALGQIRLRNTGASTATYRFQATSPGATRAKNAAGSWFEFEPDTLVLAPGEAGSVRATVAVPLGSEPGTYTALILPTNTAPGAGSVSPGLRTTFSVGAGNLGRGIGAMAARAAVSPWPWLAAVALVVLFVGLRRRRGA